MDFLMDGFMSVSCCESIPPDLLIDGLLQGMAELDLVNSKACFMSGRNVAMEPAAMPSPTSIVDHMAKSTVR